MSGVSANEKSCAHHVTWSPNTGLRIRIPIGYGFNRVSGSGFRRAKMATKVEKFKKIPVLKCEMLFFKS
jgi:hypothetical protein